MPGDAAVEAVEHHRREDAVGRLLEAAVHRHHDRVEAAEERAEREQVGQDVDALPAPARRQLDDVVGQLAVDAATTLGRSAIDDRVSCATGRRAGSS
jgi:hypothetical protein